MHTGLEVKAVGSVRVVLVVALVGIWDLSSGMVQFSHGSTRNLLIEMRELFFGTLDIVM